MPMAAATGPPDRALAFVGELEELGLEIEAAMAAIAGDRLSAFEQSVSRQEQACSRLKQLAGQLALNEPRQRTAPGALALDPELAARLRATSATLQNLNAQYSALLRHSGQSVRLLASLGTNYAGRTERAGGRVRHQTWSCEG